MGNDQGNNFGAVMIFGVAKAIEHNLRCFLIVLMLVSNSSYLRASVVFILNNARHIVPVFAQQYSWGMQSIEFFG